MQQTSSCPELWIVLKVSGLSHIITPIVSKMTISFPSFLYSTLVCLPRQSQFLASPCLFLGCFWTVTCLSQSEAFKKVASQPTNGHWNWTGQTPSGPGATHLDLMSRCTTSRGISSAHSDNMARISSVLVVFCNLRVR